MLEANTFVQDSYDYAVILCRDDPSKAEVVDVAMIQYAVGRVYDRGHWWVVDRGSENDYPEFV